MSSEEKNPLARWAQRKAAVRQRRGGAAPAIAEESAAIPVPVEAPGSGSETESKAAGGPAPESDLPDIESLTAGSDFTGFMKDGVPAELRRLALRKLWASDPMFNVIDEMVEYGEDYTNAAMVVEGMQSAWEAGRGYASKAVEEDGDDKVAPDDAQGQEPVADRQEPVADEQIAADHPAPGEEDKEHG